MVGVDCIDRLRGAVARGVCSLLALRVCVCACVRHLMANLSSFGVGLLDRHTSPDHVQKASIPRTHAFHDCTCARACAHIAWIMFYRERHAFLYTMLSSTDADYKS